MKKQKLFTVATLGIASLITLAACAKKDSDYSVDLKDKDSYTVGVLQYVTHSALDQATLGFKDEISANLPAGKTVNFVVKNPEADNTALTAQATDLVRSCDLVLGNATPAATALKAAAYTEGKNHLPILFTSVTDPVASKLVKSLEKPGKMITGTSDINPVKEQIDLAVDLKGTSCKIGFLYTSSETNSVSQCKTAKEYIKKTYSSVKTETMTINTASDISAVVSSLSSKVDVIYIPTDNICASNMQGIVNITNDKKVPLICGESSMVDNGGTFTLSIDYNVLGHTTGRMALDIMTNNTSPSGMAVQQVTEGFVFAMNSEAVNTLGLSLSQEFIDKYNISAA